MTPRNPKDPRDPKKRTAEDFDRAMRKEAILTWTSRVLMVAGLAIAAQHLFAHAGYRPIPWPMGAQDLLIGYPTGGLVLIAGLVIWGRNPTQG